MQKLSIFVDESGDFGEYQPHSPYYIVTMVIHEQDVDISLQIDRLNNSLNNLNLPNHTLPIYFHEHLHYLNFLLFYIY